MLLLNDSCYFCVEVVKKDNYYLVNDDLTFVHRLIYIIFLLVIIANFLTIYIISSTKDLNNLNGIFMLNLSFVDIMLTFINTIGNFSIDLSSKVPFTLCKIQSVLIPAMAGISAFTMILLNIDRYISIIKPLKYKLYATKNFAFISILVTWIFQFIVSSSLLWQDGQPELNNWSLICVVPITSQKVIWGILAVLDYLLMAVILLCIYTHIFLITRRLRKICHFSSNDNVGTRYSRKNGKGMKTVILIVIVYYISWSPSGLYVILKSIKLFETEPNFSTVTLYALCVNSFCNCIIYGSTNVYFKKTLLKKWKFLRRFINNSQIDEVTVTRISVK